MTRLTLSDYAGDRLKAAAFQRQADYEKRYALYNQALTDRKAKALRLALYSQDLLKKKRVFAWLVSIFLRIAHYLTPRPFKPRIARADDQENILYAGASGEQSVADYFASALDNSWTMISGYKGYRGEIDQILVGPLGVLAIEIKTTNGVIFIDGDIWTRDKYDRYGNLVERAIPIRDNGGRSPSVQINQAADALERFLRQRAPSLKRISRAAVFAHKRSRIGSVKNQTVEMIATIGSITDKAFQSVFTPFTPTEQPIDVDRIVSLIKQDHEYWRRRREGR